jgi:hypothetical protein
MSEWTIIPEILDPHHPEHRLGRHIHRPEGFETRKALEGVAGDVTWERYCAPFNQGAIGSCTGNASAGALMTAPFYISPRVFDETTAVTFYSQATHFNGQAGQFYPPNDTGSSGPAVAEALEKDLLIASYGHTTDLQSSLNALAVAPGIFGINWMTSFDTPLPTGQCPLTAGATVRGGHEIQSFRNDTENQAIWFYQSWGPSWGGLGNGTFWISYQDLTSLFGESADGTFFVPSPNAPVQYPSSVTKPVTKKPAKKKHWWSF